MTTNHDLLTAMQAQGNLVIAHVGETKKIHVIKRNGRVYDRLNSETHATMQITKSLSDDMPDDHWELIDENGEMIMSITKAIKKTN